MAKEGEVPAIICNQFFVRAGEGGVRIVFGEQLIPNTDAEYHSGIAMNRGDARDLANLINRLLDDTEKKSVN